MTEIGSIIDKQVTVLSIDKKNSQLVPSSEAMVRFCQYMFAYSNGYYEDSYQYMNKVYEIKPEYLWLYAYEMGMAELQSGDIEKAEILAEALYNNNVELPDAYKSINESLLQAAIYNDRKLNLHYIHSEKLNDGNVAEMLKGMDGILIAPGFGQRGIEGKFVAIKYARENNVPTFGICLGMQCMVIEFARNVLGYEDANSVEMDVKTRHNVIDIMDSQKSISNMGGTMRLGAYDCTLVEGSTPAKAYGSTHISERHRHRFEFNSEYREEFEKAGMKCVGTNPDTNLVEVVEIPELRWFVGTQYHPEYNSTVLRPNPLFVDFIRAAISK